MTEAGLTPAEFTPPHSDEKDEGKSPGLDRVAPEAMGPGAGVSLDWSNASVPGGDSVVEATSACVLPTA